MNLSNILNVNDHICIKSIPITENKVHIHFSAMEPVLFEKLHDIKLSHSVFRVTTFLQFNSTKVALNILLQYMHDFNENLKTLYSKLVINNIFDSRSHNERQHILSYSALLNSSFEEPADCKIQIMQLTGQVDNIFTTFDQSNPKCTKRGVIHSLFNFLLQNSNSTKEIAAIKNNMAILKDNQDILSSQIQTTFNFINLTYAETDTNRLLLKSLQKDILQINSTVQHLSKEIKSLFHNRNFLVIMFQLRSNLATIHNGINWVKIDILSILDQVSIISSQKLKHVLLNPLDLKSLLTKLETHLALHPQLALPEWNGENIWCMYKFMELCSWCKTPYTSYYTPPS